MLIRTLVAALCAGFCLAAPVRAQQNAAAVHFSIQQQSLQDALTEFGRQTGYQLLFLTNITADVMAPSVVGEFTPRSALERLLADSGLKYEFVNERTVTIKDPKRYNSAAAEATPATSSAASGVEEVIVSAQKRDERLQDVPIPMTVLDGNELAGNSQVLLRDYYNTVPSLSLVTNHGFAQTVNIRGITTGGFANPTVGITIDDVPYGASINNGGGNQMPDVDPGDLVHVEVLRGPQGTLYGANSMGGLLKYVTKRPDLTRTSGRIETGLSSVHNGADPGYQVRAAGNVPLSDTFAVRLSGYTRKDPGYIDNPVFGRESVNDASSHSARLAALWQPSSAFSARFTGLYQRTDLHGLSEINVPTAGFPWTTGLGDLEQGYMAAAGGSDRKVQAYNAVLEADLGFGQLTSVSGYNVNEYLNTFDRSANWFQNTQLHFGVGGLLCFDTNIIRKFTQELRLAVASTERFDWVAGAFFTEENSRVQQNFMAADRATGQIVGLEWFRQHPIELREYAAFASVTYRFTEQLDLQIGGRQSRIEQDDGVFAQDGAFVAGPTFSAPASSRANAFTYLVTPRWRLSPEVMVYARLASGYRPGGPNFPTAGAPDQYEPDKTENYEIGLKGDFLDRRVSIDTSLYYIDWQDLQISLRNSQGSTYFTNGSRARSQGVELSVTARPRDSLTLSGWVAFSDPELTEAFPGSGTPTSPVYGEAGDILPTAARRSGHLSIQQEFAVGNRATAFLGGALTYTGERKGTFTGTPARQVFPSFTRTDLRAGFTYDSWTANLFVNNVTDERGLIGGGIGYQPTFAYIYIQPRTIGLSLAKDF
jgi:iron complex outermembrane recepter protein